jgi:hypothetical protein
MAGRRRAQPSGQQGALPTEDYRHAGATRPNDPPADIACEGRELPAPRTTYAFSPPAASQCLRPGRRAAAAAGNGDTGEADRRGGCAAGRNACITQLYGKKYAENNLEASCRQSGILGMNAQTHRDLARFIWSICNLLRGPYKRNEYRKVILPLTVLRRFDCLLAPTDQPPSSGPCRILVEHDGGRY